MKKSPIVLTSVLALLGACTSGIEPEETRDFSDSNLSDSGSIIDSLVQQGPETYTYLRLPREIIECVEAGNGFAFNLFNSVASTQGHGNLLISPFSVFTALSMAANGDKEGEVRDEILSAYGMEAGAEGVAKLNAYSRFMLDALPFLDNKTVFHTANAVVHTPGLRVGDAFSSLAIENYDASILSERLSTREGVDNINRWISLRTNGMIPEFLKAPTQAEAAIVNTAYFKGGWANPFEEDDTYEGDFRNSDGSVTRAQFMHMEWPMKASVVEGTSYFELEFGYGNYLFCAVLPNGNDTRQLTYDEFMTLRHRASLRGVILSMPRFRTSTELNLREDFDMLGMTKMSTTGLDGLIEDRQVSLDAALHSCAIDVNEQGAEAGSATGLFWLTSSGEEGPTTIPITLDRPFHYFIIEDSTGMILYMGTLNEL